MNVWTAPLLGQRMLSGLKDRTDTILLYDTSNSVIGTGKTFTWLQPTGVINAVRIGQVLFAVPAGKTISKIKLQDAFGVYATFDITQETYNSAGTFTLNDLTNSVKAGAYSV